MTARLIATLDIASEFRNLTVRDVAEAARRLADELDRDYTVLNEQAQTEFRLPDAKLRVSVRSSRDPYIDPKYLQEPIP